MQTTPTTPGPGGAQPWMGTMKSVSGRTTRPTRVMHITHDLGV